MQIHYSISLNVVPTAVRC